MNNILYQTVFGLGIITAMALVLALILVVYSVIQDALNKHNARKITYGEFMDTISHSKQRIEKLEYQVKQLTLKCGEENEES